ncbi:hypothetical protein ACFPRL_09495 [Pseudoclavibacter helvolus]
MTLGALSGLSSRSPRLPRQPRIRGDGDEDQRARDDLLVGRVPAEQVEAVADDREDDHADDRSPDGARAA